MPDSTVSYMRSMTPAVVVGDSSNNCIRPKGVPIHVGACHERKETNSDLV